MLFTHSCVPDSDLKCFIAHLVLFVIHRQNELGLWKTKHHVQTVAVMMTMQFSKPLFSPCFSPLCSPCPGLRPTGKQPQVPSLRAGLGQGGGLNLPGAGATSPRWLLRCEIQLNQDVQ